MIIHLTICLLKCIQISFCGSFESPSITITIIQLTPSGMKGILAEVNFLIEFQLLFTSMMDFGMQNSFVLNSFIFLMMILQYCIKYWVEFNLGLNSFIETADALYPHWTPSSIIYSYKEFASKVHSNYYRFSFILYRHKFEGVEE